VAESLSDRRCCLSTDVGARPGPIARWRTPRPRPERAPAPFRRTRSLVARRGSVRVSRGRGRTEPFPRHGAKAVGSASPPVCPRSSSARRVRFPAGADRFNPCESASNPLRLRLDVLQPSLQPLANCRERLRCAIRTSLLKRGQVLGQKGEQLKQGDAGIRDVVVRPLRRVNGNPCPQRIPELLEAAAVESRRRLRHGAILP
jgi:hypothetical protein